MLTDGQRRFFTTSYIVVGAVCIVALMGLMLKSAPEPPAPRSTDNPGAPPDGQPGAKPIVYLTLRPPDVIAAITVNGAHSGQTSGGGRPLALAGLAPGKHVLKLEADGYRNWLKEIDVGHGDVNVEAELVPLPRLTLTVTSSPVHAEVSVDGVPSGRTPLVLQDLRPGSVTVRLDLEGYRPHQENVELAAGTPSELSVELKSATAEYYKDQIRENPKLLSAHVDLCHHYLVAREFDEFREWMIRTLRLANSRPDDPEYQRRLNHFVTKIRNSKATYEHLTDAERKRIVDIYNEARLLARELPPDHPLARGLKLDQLVRDGKLDQAREVLEKTVAENPGDMRWFMHPYGFKNWRNTLKVFDRQIQQHPNDLVTLYRKATLLLFAAEVRDALAALQDALPLAREKAFKVLVLAKTAELHERLGQPDKAVELYRQALAGTGDDDAKARYAFTIALLLQDGDKLDMAFPYYEQAIRLQPNREQACRWRIEVADIYRRNQRRADARRLLEEANDLTENERLRRRIKNRLEDIRKD